MNERIMKSNINKLKKMSNENATDMDIKLVLYFMRINHYDDKIDKHGVIGEHYKARQIIWIKKNETFVVRKVKGGDYLD